MSKAGVDGIEIRPGEGGELSVQRLMSCVKIHTSKSRFN